MTDINITPDTTLAEHIAQMTAGTPDETIAALAAENLNLRRRIQETLEVCGSSFINLDGFDDPDFTGMAVLAEDVTDALTGTDEPIVTKVFYAGFLKQIERNRKLQDEFQLGLKDITRITVISPTYGREHESWGHHGVELHIQDDGRTLKLFPQHKSDFLNRTAAQD